MSRRVFQFVAGLVLIFATLTPLANCFDTWDKAQPPANDTELSLTALSVFAGFIVVLPKLVRRLAFPAIRLGRQAAALCALATLAGSGWIRPEPTASPPPLLLRI